MNFKFYLMVDPQFAVVPNAPDESSYVVQFDLH